MTLSRPPITITARTSGHLALRSAVRLLCWLRIDCGGLLRTGLRRQYAPAPGRLAAPKQREDIHRPTSQRIIACPKIRHRTARDIN